MQNHSPPMNLGQQKAYNELMERMERQIIADNPSVVLNAKGRQTKPYDDTKTVNIKKWFRILFYLL